MGFDSFSVSLRRKAGDPLGDAQGVVEAIGRAWPKLKPDVVEAGRWYPPPLPEALTILVHESSEGLFQVFVDARWNKVVVDVGFAYTNPESVEAPFLGFVRWAMRAFGLACHVLPDLRPGKYDPSESEIDDPRGLDAVLPAAISYNRSLWRHDVGSDEEVALRPGDAVARFFGPKA